MILSYKLWGCHVQWTEVHSQYCCAQARGCCSVAHPLEQVGRVSVLEAGWCLQAGNRGSASDWWNYLHGHTDYYCRCKSVLVRVCVSLHFGVWAVCVAIVWQFTWYGVVCEWAWSDTSFWHFYCARCLDKSLSFLLRVSMDWSTLYCMDIQAQSASTGLLTGPVIERHLGRRGLTSSHP